MARRDRRGESIDITQGDDLTDDFNVIDLLNQYIAAGFNPLGPQGSSNPEFKTLEAYLRQVYGDLPEGAVDWASGDLDGDGVNELYAVDADGNPITVYGYDDDGNVTSTPYEEGTVFGGVASTGQGGDVSVILPPFLPPPAESKQTDGGTSGGGNVFDPTGGGILTGGGTLPPPTESKTTDGGGNGGDDTDDTDGPLDVLGEDWEYDPEHDYIYIGDCTFVQVDKNGNPIGNPVVVDYEDCDNYEIGGNYSGPDSTWDPNIDINVDIFGEGSIFDTTKDQTPTEDKQTSEPEEKEKEKTETEEKEKDVVTPPTTPPTTTTTTPTQPPTQPPTESKQTNGGNGGTVTNGNGNDGTATENKQTSETTDDITKDGEEQLTFENMYTYYSTKNGGNNNGGGTVTESKQTDGGDGDGDGDDIGDPNGMLNTRSSFDPYVNIPPYSAPTYAPLTVPQQDYMADINNLIARNSGMGLFKGYV